MLALGAPSARICGARGRSSWLRASPSAPPVRCQASGDAPRPRAAGASARGQAGGPRRRYAAEEEAEEEAPVLSRSQLLGKQVITRTSGENLGVVTQVRTGAAHALWAVLSCGDSSRELSVTLALTVSPPALQLWVDPDSWEVVALELRPGVLSSACDTVLLSSLRQVGDVVLVHDARCLEPTGPPGGCLALTGIDVVTESGEYLGKVRDFRFQPDSGRLQALLFDAFGLPQLPDSVVSVWSLPLQLVVSCAADRVVVRAGSEQRVTPLTASVLRRLQLVEPPWEESARWGQQAQDGGAYTLPAYQREAANYQLAEPRTREGPRNRDPDTQREQQPRRRAAPAEPQRQREGIPLVRRSQAFERRDADGGLGERRADTQRRPQQQQPARQFEDWVLREERVPMAQEQEGRTQAAPRQRSFDANEDLL